MNTRKWLIASGTVILVILALAVSISLAQEPEPPVREAGVEGEMDVAAIVPGAIPIQGRLTDGSGNPLDGTYNITFRLYDVESGGTPLCSDTNSVSVDDGLFSSYMDYCYDDLYGQKVWLGVEVGSDGEMEPRQVIYPVPYALTLKPGAIISDTASYVELNRYVSGISGYKTGVYGKAEGGAIRNYGVYGESDGGTGVYGKSDSAFGVSGSSGSSAGVRGYSVSGWGVFGISDSGYGVLGYSDSGVAIRAEGTGIIQSAANSYVWISGNNLVKANSDDTTKFGRDLYGGFQVTGGSGWATNKTVVLPVTIPGQLYGQDVTVTGLDLYYRVSADLTAITNINMRRQDGVDAGDLVFTDSTDYACIDAQCEEHWDLTQNNVLSDQQGILYIAFELGFASDTAYVHIGGVRLTLEHE